MKSARSKHRNMQNEVDAKKQKSKDHKRTDVALKELMDTCYLVYDYAVKSERCSYIASSEKKNGATKILFYVTYDFNTGEMKQMWELF